MTQQEATSAGAQQETLTILFTDLEGSTDMRTRLGDEVAHQVIRAHEDLIRAEIAKAGGAEAKALGDGFMILFGSARQGLTCAASIQKAVDEHNRANPEKSFKVRLGINTGEIMKERGDTYGAAVNAAARICAKSQGGQILISQLVKDLTGFTSDLRIVDRGLYWLKGFPQRWRLFEVMWRERGAEEESAEFVRMPRQRIDVPDLPRAQGPIVGRSMELQTIEGEIGKVLTSCLRVVALEGEAGIGKTRLLEATEEAAAQSSPPFSVLRVAADEELRGPFFIFRTLLATAQMESLAEEASAMDSLQRARDAVAGRDSHQGLSAQEQMLQVFDEVANAIRNISQDRPVALLIDDLQWADEDSIRLIRYLVRTIASSPILMLFTIRASAEALGGGADHLVADLDRMHLARRIRLSRFARAETSELLKNLLGAAVSTDALGMLHARAEGVPFFIEEFARAYRETGALQLVGDTWAMTQLSGPQVPASVTSLIERRLAQLETETRTLLSDAAILGRRFRVDDLSRIATSISDGGRVESWRIDEKFEDAIKGGIISEMSQHSDYDYAFTHDQIRAALMSSLTRQRRRRIHSAIADMLIESETSDTSNLTALAHHALQAGDEKRGVACAIRAATATLESHAPEESVRIIDSARAAAQSPEERAQLLRIKDEALALLERGNERTANLSEMAALASAIGDPAFEMEVKLRRASSARMTGDLDLAADLARGVREQARSQDDKSMELQACLELGQALMRSPLGESFVLLHEVDIEAAEEPFERAIELARELDDKPSLAASLREFGVLGMGRARERALEILGEGKRILAAIMDQELNARLKRVNGLVSESLRIYEELGDRRGMMSALISLAYSHVTEFSRRGDAGRIEQVRRLRNNLKRMTTETERAIDEAYMLYSIHVFARSRTLVDLALERGREGYEASRSIGNRWLEFLCAGGMALTHMSLNEPEEAEAWLERAQHAALAVPGPAVARRLECWKGLLAVAKGDPNSAIERFERAVQLATDQGSAAGRCEMQSTLAIEAAKLGESLGSDELLDKAEKAAESVRRNIRTLAGETAWEANAWAATALVAMVRGDDEGAAEAARSALACISPRLMRALYTDVYWIAARALIPSQAPEAQDLAAGIMEFLMLIDNSMVDPQVKERWTKVPVHRALMELSGYQGFTGERFLWHDAGLEEIEVELLKQLTTGKSDEEIAGELDRDKAEVSELVEGVFEKIGATTRLEATEFALRGGIV